MRKYLSLLLALIMVLSMIPMTVGYADDVKTITVFIGDPYDQPTSDNKIFKLIEEKMGLKFEFEFLAGDLDETLGIKIAGEDYADLMCGSNSADTLINNGALIDLMPYLSEEKTPRLWEHIEPYLGRLLNDDGQLFIIPNYGRNYNDQITNYCNGPAFWIQKKVLEWDGYPQIKTLDQYFDLIERFITANPTDENGTPYSGFEILCDGWRSFCLRNPVQHLMGRPNDGDVFVYIDDNYKTETFINQPYAKQYYKKLNEAYHKGLISQDTFVMNFDQYIAKLSNGTVLGMFDQYWDFQSATDALVTAGMYDSTYIGLPLVYDESIEEHYLNGATVNVNRGYGISVNCDDPELLINMMEEFLSDEWQTIFNWGIEGEDYYVENGRFLRTQEQKDNDTNAVWRNSNKAKQLFDNLPKKQGTRDDGNAWEPGNQPELYFDMMSDYDKDFLTAYGYKVPADFFNPAIELAPYGEAWQIDYSAETDVSDVSTEFATVQVRDLPQIIMAANDEEFDAKWDAFVKTVEDLPISTFVDYMQEQILRLVEANK